MFDLSNGVRAEFNQGQKLAVSQNNVNLTAGQMATIAFGVQNLQNQSVYYLFVLENANSSQPLHEFPQKDQVTYYFGPNPAESKSHISMAHQGGTYPKNGDYVFISFMVINTTADLPRGSYPFRLTAYSPDQTAYDSKTITLNVN